jgi:hypothetical protein
MKVIMKKRPFNFLLSLTFASLLTGGCTTQAWYEGINLRAENECAKQAPGAREECRASVNKKPYDAYEKERATTK